MLAVINQSLPPLLCSKVLKMNKEQVLSLVLFLMSVAPILVFFSLPHFVFNPAFLSPSNSLLQLLSDRFIHWSRSNIKVTSELELHQDSAPPLPPTFLPPICFNPITSSSCAVSANRLQGGNPSYQVHAVRTQRHTHFQRIGKVAFCHIHSQSCKHDFSGRYTELHSWRISPALTTTNYCLPKTPVTQA